MPQDFYFRRDRTVGPEDLDWLEHVNNVVWVRFMAELATAHMTSIGFGVDHYRKTGGAWVARTHHITYHRPAVGGEVLIEETWIPLLKGARSTRRCRFRRAEDLTLLVESTSEWVFISTATGRPSRIERALLDNFRTIAEPPEN